jgi:hypothetical protein
MSCILCSHRSRIRLLDYKKICSICYEKAVEVDMDFDKPDEYMLCDMCESVVHIGEFCSVCAEGELKNGTDD